MNTLLKNSHHTVRIEGYSADGSGVARIGGQVVFVKGALNGELCEIKIIKTLKNLAYAKLKRVIEHSESRTAPVCP
ncbi:MAG: TRAM domain-containing protein, partial [Clostridiales bacterium]|nr:TRAM domain-containing protein [Clostridiales bacterium]